jgi:hypothetical protein
MQTCKNLKFCLAQEYSNGYSSTEIIHHGKMDAENSMGGESGGGDTRVVVISSSAIIDYSLWSVPI